ncbi:transaldolase [Congregibacter sp.]|uniref:transaldolase n=1 Tax=Congregibacter sp. TaxID=2744308 RepID=UPI0039E2D129
MTDKLSQLKTMTDVVADTGDIEAIRRYTPIDATTNPSLLLKAAALPHYQTLLQSAKARAASETGSRSEQLAACCDYFAIGVGQEILSIVPGRVSTEVDARLSFDSNATKNRARRLIALYEEAGIAKDRILIKIASTWEGIRAAQQLEQEGIQCNLTLLFGFEQAQACADAGVFLISPFVGRILDWHKAQRELSISSGKDDPGVQSVERIYNYYKQHGYQTVIMGASFRNVGEIEALAGCDRLTISPALLEVLANDTDELPQQLSPAGASSDDAKNVLNESNFRLGVNEDAMATEKLAEGIRNFIADQKRLERLIESL